MQDKSTSHTFHIPVMGTGFTIDTPIRVAPYGIDSVISIMDDTLIEKMRGYHSYKRDLPYVPIGEKENDYRARRITAYLDLVHDIVHEMFTRLRTSPFTPGSAITTYFEMLPAASGLKRAYLEMIAAAPREQRRKQDLLRKLVVAGAIDVNIMTKLDKVNYNGKARPAAYNDAHAALRGFAMSKLSSSVIMSAGMNPRLYGYMTEFNDFLPDQAGALKKKITLKVSDFRSALVQGKFLARKGLWVSEFRIESGLNCGGHAFATDGHLLGPILNEFKRNRRGLIEELHELYIPALQCRKISHNSPLPVRITAQGGVGTALEHAYLLDHYQLDSVGWGSPFLLVPEVVSIDEKTLGLLCQAKEEDLYLSNISPLGVPFNTVKGTTIERERKQRVASGKPGSPCLRAYLAFNTEFTQKPLCVASRKYQRRKIEELKDRDLSADDYAAHLNQIVEKSCICTGLGNTALLSHELKPHRSTRGISVCPGPNLAYFSKELTLAEMVSHLYGRQNVIEITNRPNMFLKEVKLYIEYLRCKIDSCTAHITARQVRYLTTFHRNLTNGLVYYQSQLPKIREHFGEMESKFKWDLRHFQNEVEQLQWFLQLAKIQYDAAQCTGVPR